MSDNYSTISIIQKIYQICFRYIIIWSLIMYIFTVHLQSNNANTEIWLMKKPIKSKSNTCTRIYPYWLNRILQIFFVVASDPLPHPWAFLIHRLNIAFFFFYIILKLKISLNLQPEVPGSGLTWCAQVGFSMTHWMEFWLLSIYQSLH